MNKSVITGLILSIVGFIITILNLVISNFDSTSIVLVCCLFAVLLANISNYNKNK